MAQMDMLKKTMKHDIVPPTLDDRRAVFLRGSRLGADVLQDLHLSNGVVQKLEENMALRNSLVGMEPKERLLAAKKLVVNGLM